MALHTFGSTLNILSEALSHQYPNSFNIALKIVSEVVGVKTIDVLSNVDKTLTLLQVNVVRDQINKIKQGIPVSYIINNIEFYGDSYLVNKNTLIPRPESELLVDLILNLLKSKKSSTILEIGTGSGCLSISILKYSNSKSKILATDKSNKTINVAKKNAEAILPSDKLNDLQFKVEDYLLTKPKGMFDVIVSNPPYIPEEEYFKLDKSLFFEPKIALTDSKDGLVFYRHLAISANMNLKPGGAMFLEIHSEKATNVDKIFRDTLRKPYKAKIYKDLFGRDRVFSVTLATQ